MTDQPNPMRPNAGGKDQEVRREEREKPWPYAEEDRLGYPEEQPSDEAAAHAQEETRQKPNTDQPESHRPVDEDPAG